MEDSSSENHLDNVDFLPSSATDKNSSKLKQSSVDVFLCDLMHMFIPYTFLFMLRGILANAIQRFNKVNCNSSLNKEYLVTTFTSCC